MSIVSQLLHGDITFGQAARQAEEWASKVAASDPALTQAAGVLLSAAKQGASDAIALADTALGPLVTTAAKALEVELDAALNAATKGASLPLNAITDTMIDTIARTMVATAHTWALNAKAALADQGAGQAAG